MEVIKIEKDTIMEFDFSYGYTSHAYYEVKKNLEAYLILS